MTSRADKESHTRSLLKAISWRIIGTVDTVILSWILTGYFLLALSIGGAELITKTALYYFHERAWQMVPRGSIRIWVRRIRSALNSISSPAKVK